MKTLTLVPIFEGLIELTQKDNGVIEKQEILTTCEVKELFKEFVKSWENKKQRKKIIKAIENINDFKHLTVTHIPIKSFGYRKNGK